MAELKKLEENNVCYYCKSDIEEGRYVKEFITEEGSVVAHLHCQQIVDGLFSEDFPDMLLSPDTFEEIVHEISRNQPHIQAINDFAGKVEAIYHSITDVATMDAVMVQGFGFNGVFGIVDSSELEDVSDSLERIVQTTHIDRITRERFQSGNR